MFVAVFASLFFCNKSSPLISLVLLKRESLWFRKQVVMDLGSLFVRRYANPLSRNEKGQYIFLNKIPPICNIDAFSY